MANQAIGNSLLSFLWDLWYPKIVSNLVGHCSDDDDDDDIIIISV
jgi:hypothetical protein